MFGHSEFKSEDELNKFYSDHLESLLSWDGPFDEDGLRAEWTEAVSRYRLAKVIGK